jgi:hypothetical protein
MSYTFHTAAPKAALVDALTDEAARVHLNAYGHAEAMEQIGQAIAWVGALAKVIGPEGAAVAVTISGHANPGHRAAEGWSEDQLTVSLRVLSE